MSRSVVNGLVVERRGSGTPVVLVHGTNGNLHSFDPLLPYLAGFEIWTYARRDYEPSRRSNGVKTLKAEADDLASVIAHAGKRAHVLGSSYGGIVALHAARIQPELFIPPLLLFEPPLFAMGPASALAVERFRTHLEAGQLREASRLYLAEVARMPAALLDVPTDPPRYDELRSCLSDLEAMAADVEGVRNWADVTVPVVVIEGAETWDPMPRTMDQLALVLPSVRRRPLEGQSHFATHSAPCLFARVVREELSWTV
ncbi:MAG TPA: alpha/beta hydrolase [Gaiellaceae bacterium]|jgi:pimeloyl-ACP methyl ester carboxylesterase|nr:alpha/beta hydrolase [Gaiellaceae bacterium]